MSYKNPFIALYSAVATAADAPLLVIFANRDARTAEDIAGTILNVEAEGESVHVREFVTVAEIPHVLTLTAHPIVANAQYIATPAARPVPAPAPVSTAVPAELGTASEMINRKYQNRTGNSVARNGSTESYGDTYQLGVMPGPKKLAQFREVLAAYGVPALRAQDGKGDAAIAYVKLFCTSGDWTWYITEWDAEENEAYGVVCGFEREYGYMNLTELANITEGVGIEIDMHWTPRPIGDCK